MFVQINLRKASEFYGKEYHVDYEYRTPDQKT